jgi:UDP-N-acetylglucosamine--N-acetylmuramyl-(pentapeptide) pyrophosphoryl-undecaprenol N-acetylglucosamine transferase
LYPGIALARELVARDPQTTVSFAGTAAGIEARVVPREGFSLDLIRVAGLKGKSIAHLIRGVGLLPLSAVDAWRVISRRCPDVVIGVGGYASGPVLALAAMRGYPTLVLEQNALPGLTNRLLARLVRAAAVTFEETRRFFPGVGFVTGNPVRPEFIAAGTGTRVPVETTASPTRVLVFGGSQGAHAINKAMVAAAPRLAASGARLVMVHQTGPHDRDEVQAAYAQAGIEARVETFMYEMATEMSAADIVVCRAGATTIAEITAAGRAAILIPLPTATDDHQRKNALVLARAGAAEVIDETEASGDRLADAIVALVHDAARRTRMADAARALARPDAAARIADRVWQLAGGGR